MLRWNRRFLERSNIAGTRMRFAGALSPTSANGTSGGAEFQGDPSMQVVGHDAEEQIFEEEMTTCLWP